MKTGRQIGRATSFLLAVLASACFSIKPIAISVDDFAKIEPILWSECSISSSSYQVTVKNPSFGSQHLDLDLLLQDPESWEVEGTDLLGRELFRLTYINGGFTNRYSRGIGLDRLEVDPDGFLAWDNHFVPFKAQDVAAILHSCLPLRWRRLKWQYVTEVDASTAIKAQDLGGQNSEILIVRKSNGSICSKVSWRVLLGLSKQEISWCRSEQGANRESIMYFSFSGSTQISWKPLVF
jgi:hypothetical protein